MDLLWILGLFHKLSHINLILHKKFVGNLKEKKTKNFKRKFWNENF
jgi:hypothetical protein